MDFGQDCQWKNFHSSEVVKSEIKKIILILILNIYIFHILYIDYLIYIYIYILQAVGSYTFIRNKNDGKRQVLF